MGKISKRKQQRQALVAAVQKNATIAASDDAPDGPVQPPSPETIAYLEALSSSPPETYWSQEFKGLRRAMFPFVKMSLSNYTLPDYAAQITTLLIPPHNTRVGYQRVILNLTAIRDLSIDVKQGTIQRWVRMVDECDDPSLKLKLLSSIVGCQLGQEDGEAGHVNKHDPSKALQALMVDGVVDPASPKPQSHDDMEADPDYYPPTREDDIEELGTFVAPLADVPPTSFTVGSQFRDHYREVLRIQAAERMPPNLHDLVVRMTDDPVCNAAGSHGLFQRDGDQGSLVKAHPVPNVPGAYLLSDVLTSAEADYIRGTAEAMGFSKNEVIGKDDTHIGECEWLTCATPEKENKISFENESGMLGTIFARAEPHIPTMQNKTAVGVNSRFRCFRYNQGGIYRMHIDGSWSAAGLNEGTMVNDVTTGAVKSRMTFLMYLNDDFEGGETTFFLPKKNGGLQGVRVRPRKGSVLIFPQGNEASLLHEGSVVTKGTKWVVRTDILFGGFK